MMDRIELEDEYRRALAPCGLNRYLSAWVGGSHAHGDNLPDSDIDLYTVITPTANEVLLGHADYAQTIAGPDIVVMTIQSYIKKLLKGAPNILESLSLPRQCLIFDNTTILMLQPLLPGLTTVATVNSALGNARHNIDKLETRTDLDDRARRKLAATTIRLLGTVRDVCDNNEPWRPWSYHAPAGMLREIRKGERPIPDLHAEYAKAEESSKKAPDRWLPESTRLECENILLKSHYDTVIGKEQGGTVNHVIDAVADFADNLNRAKA